MRVTERVTRKDLAMLAVIRAPQNPSLFWMRARFARLQRLRRLGLLDGRTITARGDEALAVVEALGLLARLRAEYIGGR